MYKKILKLVIIFVLIFNWIFGYPPIYENFWRAGIWQNPQIPPEIQETQAATRTIEQQINIIDQEYTNATGDYLPDNNDLGSLGIIKFDPDKYNAETLYFEAVLTVNNGTYIRVRSDSFSVPATAQQYTVKVKAGVDASCASGGTVAFVQLYSITSSSEVTSILSGCGTPSGTASIKAARLIIVQSDGTSITATETQIEVGNKENITSGSYGYLLDRKIYLYDHDKFDPAPTAYFEATLKSSPTYSEATYYFSGHDANEKWPTDPEKMVDGDTGTWAKAGNSSVTQLNNSNTCDATCAARSETITKVELRIHACAESGDNPDIILKPVFPGPLDGNDHTYTPNAVCASNNGSNAYWSEDFNITTDDNAPSPWTWSAIQTLDCDVFFNRQGGPDYGYATRVEIIVTYESGTGTAYAQLYNKTNGTAVSNSEVSVNSTSWTLIRGENPLSTNWDTASDDEYYVEIKNSSGTTAYIANAKIVLTQTDGSGIDKFETVQQYVNTADGSPALSGSSATYARLAVAGGAEVTDSTVSTTSNSYDRQRTASSISLTNNNYDAEVKGDGDPGYTQTDYDNQYTSTNWAGGTFDYYFEATIARPRPTSEISNAWLIIQVSGLATSLSTTIQIRNVADNADVSSITFPAGDISSPVSNPTGNVDVQNLTATGSAAAPVAILKSSTAYTLWYNVTDTSGWADTVASEKFYTLALGGDLTLTYFNDNADNMTVWDTDQSTTQALSGSASKELFLQITLSSNYGKTGQSTLSVLGETP